MTMPWVSADTEIWDYDASDAFIWYPDASTSLIWQLINDFDVCSPESGRINSGGLELTYTQDDKKFILNEMNNTPGMCYLFQHFSVPDDEGNYFLEFTGSYRGTHQVEFEAFDWDSSSYIALLSTDTTGAFVLEPSLFTQTFYMTIPQGSQYFSNVGIYSNVLQIRVIHDDPGNSGHLLRINYWELHSGSV